MSLQNLTIKSQERIQHAQQLAFNNNNANIETEHLLQSLLDDEDSPIEFLLKKNNVNINFVETKLAESIKKLAKASGVEPAPGVAEAWRRRFALLRTQMQHALKQTTPVVRSLPGRRPSSAPLSPVGSVQTWETRN